MNVKQLLTNTLLVATLLIWGSNFAWGQITLPTPVYSQDFESASTTVGEAGSNFGITGATLKGSGAIQTGDALFGQFYQNMPEATASSTRTNYLTISTDAFSATNTAGNNAITISFWINAFYANSQNIGSDYASIFVAYGTGGNAAHGYPFGLDTRAGFGVHSSLYNYFYDYNNATDYNSRSWLTVGSSLADSWHHVALVYSQDENYNVIIKQYVDGKFVNSLTKANGNASYPALSEMQSLDQLKEFVIGGNSPVWEDPDNAYAYDEINIYSQALTVAQVKKIYWDKKSIAFAEDFTKDYDGGTSTDPTKYGFSKSSSLDATVTDGLFSSEVNGASCTYSADFASTILSGNLVTFSCNWTPGGATGKGVSRLSLTDNAGNIILKLQKGAGNNTNYQVFVNDVNVKTLGSGNNSDSYAVSATIDMSSKKIKALSIGNIYTQSGEIDFLSLSATTMSKLVFYHTKQNGSWSNTAKIDNISITYQTNYAVTVNALYGETVLGTEVFSALTGETLYYGWPKYILKNGVLYYNQSRSAGKQYTASATESNIVNNTYYAADLGTSTPEYYNEIGLGVTQGGNTSSYLRASHGNTSSVSGKSSKGSCVMTVAAAGILPSGTYTFEIGNYGKRGSIIKVADREIGTTASAGNSGTFILTTINNVTVYEGETVSIINAEGTSATENIDYFLAIRTGNATVSATIGATGWTTFASPYALNLSSMTASTGEVKAYYASAVGGSSVTMTSTEAAIQAGEGIMLKGTPTATITIPVVASGSAIEGNKLVGVTTNTTITKETENYANFYVLSNNGGTAEFQNLKNWLESKQSGSDTEYNTVTINAGKAYLDATTAAPGARLSIVFDDATGISDASRLMDSGEWTKDNVYNLKGQRVSQPTKGLYIVNGKKVIMK